MSDMHKYRNVISMMEVEENLPLPTMSEESQLISQAQLRKVGVGGECVCGCGGECVCGCGGECVCGCGGGVCVGVCVWV